MSWRKGKKNEVGMIAEKQISMQPHPTIQDRWCEVVYWTVLCFTLPCFSFLLAVLLSLYLVTLLFFTLVNNYP